MWQNSKSEIIILAEKISEAGIRTQALLVTLIIDLCAEMLNAIKNPLHQPIILFSSSGEAQNFRRAWAGGSAEARALQNWRHGVAEMRRSWR